MISQKRAPGEHERLQHNIDLSAISMKGSYIEHNKASIVNIPYRNSPVHRNSGSIEKPDQHKINGLLNRVGIETPNNVLHIKPVCEDSLSQIQIVEPYAHQISNLVFAESEQCAPNSRDEGSMLKPTNLFTQHQHSEQNILRPNINKMNNYPPERGSEKEPCAKQESVQQQQQLRRDQSAQETQKHASRISIFGEAASQGVLELRPMTVQVQSSRKEFASALQQRLLQAPSQQQSQAQLFAQPPVVQEPPQVRQSQALLPSQPGQQHVESQAHLSSQSGQQQSQAHLSSQPGLQQQQAHLSSQPGLQQQAQFSQQPLPSVHQEAFDSAEGFENGVMQRFGSSTKKTLQFGQSRPLGTPVQEKADFQRAPCLTEQQARVSSGVMQLPFGIQREINSLKAENEKLREGQGAIMHNLIQKNLEISELSARLSAQEKETAHWKSEFERQEHFKFSALTRSGHPEELEAALAQIAELEKERNYWRNEFNGAHAKGLDQQRSVSNLQSQIERLHEECGRLTESQHAESKSQALSLKMRLETLSDENMFLKCELNCERQQNVKLLEKLEHIKSEETKLNSQHRIKLILLVNQVQVRRARAKRAPWWSPAKKRALSERTRFLVRAITA